MVEFFFFESLLFTTGELSFDPVIVVGMSLATAMVGCSLLLHVWVA